MTHEEQRESARRIEQIVECISGPPMAVSLEPCSDGVKVRIYESVFIHNPASKPVQWRVTDKDGRLLGIFATSGEATKCAVLSFVSRWLDEAINHYGEGM